MILSKKDYKDYLIADKLALGRKEKRPKYQDLIWRYEILLRQCEYIQNCKRGFFWKCVLAVLRYLRFRIGTRCNFSIPVNTCGKGLCIQHIGPIIISNHAKVGEYCRIHVGVNIGADARKGDKAPKIGNRVYIGPGAKLFGEIIIADGCAVGANSVVNKSFLEPNMSIGGIPAKVLSEGGSKGIIKI